jgi:hypothetical protein
MTNHTEIGWQKMRRKKRILAKFEQEILSCKQRLRELEPHVKYNAGIAMAYNRKLIEKAILIDKYKKVAHRPTIGQKIKDILSFGRREKLICDFFNE